MQTEQQIQPDSRTSDSKLSTVTSHVPFDDNHYLRFVSGQIIRKGQKFIDRRERKAKAKAKSSQPSRLVTSGCAGIREGRQKCKVAKRLPNWKPSHVTNILTSRFHSSADSK